MSKELATKGGFVALSHGEAELREVYSENLGNESISAFDLERVTVPSGGGTQWTIQDIEEGERSVKKIEGIIIYWRNVRVYYETKFSGGNERPDCVSDDGVRGVGDPGGVCTECPYAQWGSDESGGQKCQQKKMLFVLQRDSMLPLVISVPPTSIKAIKGYFLRLTAKMVPYWAVVTKLELAKTKNEAGISYSVVVPSLGSRLSEEEAAKARAIQAALRPALQAVRAESNGHSGEEFEHNAEHETGEDEARADDRFHESASYGVDRSPF